MTGKVRIGVTVTGCCGGNVDIRVIHSSRGLPLISALHDPHLPALQFHRTPRVGASWGAGGGYTPSSPPPPSFPPPPKPTSPPPPVSPRHTRKCRCLPM